MSQELLTARGRNPVHRGLGWWRGGTGLQNRRDQSRLKHGWVQTLTGHQQRLPPVSDSASRNVDVTVRANSPPSLHLAISGAPQRRRPFLPVPTKKRLRLQFHCPDWVRCLPGAGATSRGWTKSGETQTLEKSRGAVPRSRGTGDGKAGGRRVTWPKPQNTTLNNSQKGSYGKKNHKTRFPFYESKTQAEHKVLFRDTEIPAEAGPGLVEVCFVA